MMKVLLTRASLSVHRFPADSQGPSRLSSGSKSLSLSCFVWILPKNILTQESSITNQWMDAEYASLVNPPPQACPSTVSESFCVSIFISLSNQGTMQNLDWSPPTQFLRICQCTWWRDNCAFKDFLLTSATKPSPKGALSLRDLIYRCLKRMHLQKLVGIQRRKEQAFC